MNKTKTVSLPNAVFIITTIILTLFILAVTPLGNLFLPFVTSPVGKTLMSTLLLIWFSLSLIVDYKHWSEYNKNRKYFVFITWIIIIGVFIVSAIF